MKRSKKAKAAFTLIELLLVVVIIGILAAIVVPRLVGRSMDAQIAQAKGNITSFANALKLYELDNGFFPTTDQGLQALIEMPAGEPQPKKWRKYLDAAAIPLDPWGKPYVFLNPGIKDPNGFDLFCLGPDGQEGTADDIDPRSNPGQ
jgi:general secretion pathway protein G